MDQNGKFYFTFAGWSGCGLVCRIGCQVSVLPIYGTRREIFEAWQIRTRGIPTGVIMNLELLGETA